MMDRRDSNKFSGCHSIQKLPKVDKSEMKLEQGEDLQQVTGCALVVLQNRFEVRN